MTPFDAALRIQQREVDAVRIGIFVSIARSDALAEQRRALASRIREEHAQATVWALASDAWRARMSAQAASLDSEAALAEARLIQLRAEAASSYSRLHLLEGAAERHTATEMQAMAAAEQRAIDDLTAMAFLRAKRGSRRSR